MKKISVILLLGFWYSSSVAQADTSFRLVKTIKGDIANFTVDNSDNIYILDSRNQLKKLNANGDSVAVFNDVRKFGRATYIDVSNPLRLLLYYKDFSTIVVLDRFLNVRNTIDLRKKNIFQVKAVALAYDNNIWLYDELENKLKKIDEDGNQLLETPDFRLLFGEAPSPQIIFDQDKFVYLYDSAKSVFVFDYFGGLKNKILITGWKNFKVVEKYIYGSDDKMLHRYEISSFRLDDWIFPPQLKEVQSFNFTKNYLYALRKSGPDNYQIEVYSYR